MEPEQKEFVLQLDVLSKSNQALDYNIHFQEDYAKCPFSPKLCVCVK